MGEQKKYWEGKHFAFYTNKECEYYPCHPVPEGTEFNCLFCYCPLYMLGFQPIHSEMHMEKAPNCYAQAGAFLDIGSRSFNR